MSISIQLDTKQAEDFLEDLKDRITPHKVRAEVGPRATRLTQRHLRSLGENKKGWPSTHFYGRAAEATNWQEGFGYLLVVINQIGIRQRVIGGKISPVNAGALTIPASPEAYGKTTKDFPKLQLKFLYDPESGRIRPALVEPQGRTHLKLGRKKKDGTRNVTVDSVSTGLAPLFWLAKSVKQAPNPNVLPSDDDYREVFDQSMSALLKYESSR